MSYKYLACIFDLDGTLANTLDSIAYFGNATLHSFGLPEISTDRYKMLVGDGAQVLMERMLKETGVNVGSIDIASFRKEYDRRYEREPMKFVTSYPGLPTLLTQLNAAGVKLGVLSNKPDNMVKYIANALYPNLLNVVYGQREGIPKKPHPDALLSMADELSLLPRNILYIGDSGVDIDTGHNAGMDTCGVLWGFRNEEELKSHGAKFLVKDWVGLKEIIEKQ